MKIGLLVHSLFLDAADWERVVWGEPPHTLGSIPKAAETALFMGPERIAHAVFGTGLSSRDGLTEAEYTRREMLTNLDRLSAYPALAMTEKKRAALNKLFSRSALPTTSRNTLDEIVNAAAYFNAEGCTHVVHVPMSGTHAPRCVKTLLAAKTRGLVPPEQFWILAAPDTALSGTAIDDVAIMEPLHRTDDPMLGAPVQLNAFTNRVFKLPPEKRKQFLIEADTLLKEEYE